MNEVLDNSAYSICCNKRPDVTVVTIASDPAIKVFEAICPECLDFAHSRSEAECRDIWKRKKA